MSAVSELEIEELRKYIGREASATDVVTPHKCMALLATLDKDPTQLREGDEAPLAIHWCLAQPTVRMRSLGPDGHPTRGDFLPAVPLPRRMWAGGKLQLVDPIRVGERTTHLSRIEEVKLKDGRTGSLCFVTISHRVSTNRGLVIEERQDIVYRGAEQPAPASPQARRAAPEAPWRQAEWSQRLVADPVLLFRYSALTFNAHRIHYDRNYATVEEGYPGLVVHGPLQATLLVTLAGALRGMPRTFDFRGISPLCDGAEFTVNAAPTETGLDLWVADSAGRATMTASATW